MNRLQITLFAVLGLVAALVVVVALRNPQAPLMPPDPEHATFTGHEPCLVCHGLEGGVPRSLNHPIGNDCLRCHGRP